MKSTTEIACAEIEVCIANNVLEEGSFKNCRWVYYPDSMTLGIASKSNFDRWANSRIIEIHPTLLDSGDPSLIAILTAIGEIC